MIVDSYLNCVGSSNIYSIGDCSNWGDTLKLAYTSELQGHITAHNIQAQIDGTPRHTFPHYYTGNAFTLLPLH